MIIDCYHNDITQIVEARSGVRLLRKMHRAARYARRHGGIKARMTFGANKLIVFTWRTEADVGFVPDAEGWAQWQK